MVGQDSAHDVLIDLYAKGQSNLLRNPRTTPARIPSFHLDYSVDELFDRSFWTRLDFQTIGVTLFRGPGFSATAEPAVILGYRYWQNHFASDPDVIGKTLTLDDIPHVVTGIAPAQFDGHLSGNGEVAVFLPLERHPRFRTDATDRSKSGCLSTGA